MDIEYELTKLDPQVRKAVIAGRETLNVELHHQERLREAYPDGKHWSNNRIRRHAQSEAIKTMTNKLLRMTHSEQE
jgi:hypothetical protein